MRRVAIVLMVLSTGCGGGRLASDADVAARPDSSPVPAVDVARDIGPLDGVALALDGAEALAESSFEMVAEARVAGRGQAFSMSAAFAGDGRTGMLRLDVLGESIEMRFIGDTVYMSSNFLSFMFPVDTPWIGIADAEQTATNGVDMDAFSADELLALLRIVDSDAEIVGTEEIDGVTATRVRGEVSVEELADAGIDEMLADLDVTGGSVPEVDSFTIDVWVGDDGIPRRVLLAAEDVFEFSMDIRSVGEPVQVAVPPADQVTWMEDLVGDFGFEPA